MQLEGLQKDAPQVYDLESASLIVSFLRFLSILKLFYSFYTFLFYTLEEASRFRITIMVYEDTSIHEDRNTKRVSPNWFERQ